MATQETPVDNGVNVQALLDARNALTEAPEGAQFTWRASARVAERHAQPDHRRGLLRPRRRAEPPHDVLASTPTIPRSSPPRITARRPWSSCSSGSASCLTAGIAAVAQNRGIQLDSVKATIEGDMDILGILGADPEVRNGFNDIRVSYEIDADATPGRDPGRWSRSRRSARRCSTSITNPTNVTVEVN